MDRTKANTVAMPGKSTVDTTRSFGTTAGSKRAAGGYDVRSCRGMFVFLSVVAIGVGACGSEGGEFHDAMDAPAAGDSGEPAKVDATETTDATNDLAIADDVASEVDTTPECIIPGPGLDRRSCFYSRCIGPPMAPMSTWCAASALDDGALCCDSKWSQPWGAGNGFWRITGPQCEDNPATRYPTCPFYEDDGVTFYGRGVQ